MLDFFVIFEYVRGDDRINPQQKEIVSINVQIVVTKNPK